MNTYHEIHGTIEGETELLFGSFSKGDCQFELQAEKVSWADQGYSNLVITNRETDESPDPVVYADDDDVDTTTPTPDPVHFFASCAFGWATADTRDEAIEKLVNSFRRDYKDIVKNSHKRGEAGAYVWTCQVNAPADENYSIEYYAPKGVDIEDAQEHAITYLTDKVMAHCRIYDQEVKNLRAELADQS